MAFPTMWIVLTFLLLPIVDATWPKVPQIPVPSAFQRSPLDDDYASYYDDPPPKGSLIPSPNDFASLPTCQHACLKPLMEVLGAAIRSKTTYDRFFAVCDKYNETVVCMKKGVPCGNRDLFDILTSGLKYMCYDQRETFEARMECIDATAAPITSECHKNCNSKDKFTTLIADSGLLEMLLPHDNRDDRDANGRTFLISRFDPKAMSATMRTSCDLAECFLDCIKTRYNNHCGDNIGNFVTEAIVRPIVKTHEGGTFAAFGGLIGSMLPETCSFLVAPEKLRNFRVDPDVERQIKPEFVKSQTPYSAVSSSSKSAPANATLSTAPTNTPEVTPASEVARKLAITAKTTNHGDLFATKLHKNESFLASFALHPDFDANLVCVFDTD
uniref:CPG4 domain-containing protein n=1 Tax=Panagrellus redivivus TaxID=6233 RepID=A0A7E4VC30_PANRE